MKYFILFLGLPIVILNSVKAQKKTITIKANSTLVDIREDKKLLKKAWTISPEIKPDVHFTDAMNGYAVGGSLNIGNVALKTIDGGVTWTSMAVGNTTLSYRDVDFSSLSNGIIITRDSVYSTFDAGTTWTKEDFVNNVTGGLGNNAVSAFNESGAVAISNILLVLAKVFGEMAAV